MAKDLYIGTWILIPELCNHQVGELPLEGTYVIDQEDSRTDISISWTTAEGESMSTSFGGENDGSRIPIDAPGITHFSITRKSASILESDAFNEDELVSHAERNVSKDGGLLTALQIGYLPDDSEFRNYQVYRRKAE
ncbi:MAG: hypothetical protein GKR91_20660 [Pseudomonadales bacterium]|nr:hypothetical protein [Pseudomonadales bacterium]